MYIQNRILLLIACLVLAWFGALGGVQVHNWVIFRDSFDLVMVTIVGTVAFLFAMVATWGFVDDFASGSRVNSASEVFHGGIITVCFAFVHAIIAGSTGIDSWTNPWNFLLVLGALPPIIAAKEIVADIVTICSDKPEQPERR